ncbi:uncharacterized protein LAESUDRAFT_759693 [Laetiporus sulphureus 93-53]|uniref:Uncharacterized protein n=1 Tax=Laetiporus sulphureus 93-53 TaxID=1314785 RepID=A0A165E3E3_9APHY|nr:uncharacterized protein LAESUDRAFT_759693 [Laetiporus sulphureus 93-53]KZT06169.1 hypothetical protein LAESUDRAFT_759693 [Laetiporus sulphureus 93-53]
MIDVSHQLIVKESASIVVHDHSLIQTEITSNTMWTWTCEYLTYSTDPARVWHLKHRIVTSKQAVLNAIAYLLKDTPNACVMLALPAKIFEHDILLKEDGPRREISSNVRSASDGVV